MKESAFFIGGVFGLFVAAVILAVMKTKKKLVYDERQLQQRHKALLSALATLVLCNLLSLAIAPALSELFDLKNIIYYLIFASLIICAAVFACVCIWLDAWMSLKERPRRVVISNLIYLVAVSTMSILRICTGNFDVTVFVMLCCAFLCATILINYGIKCLVSRRQSDEESET